MFFQFRQKLIFFGIIFLFVPFFVQATIVDFNVDPAYDYLGRSEVTAFLHQLGNNAYFYVEEDYYNNLSFQEKEDFRQALKALSQEFDKTIYPKLTKTFGSEWKPGIDKDEKITVLLSRIKKDFGGYFNSGDEYPKIQAPTSNEREMIYLNVDYLSQSLAKNYLAHEFLHLITFNQKKRIQGLTEEIWLNEGRAEIAATFLGYDKDYQNSNLKKRVTTFVQKPEDSLTEWKNLSSDYGVLNLFFQYLLDHYGIEILVDSLSSKNVGIPSLNYALKKRGYSEDFSQIFTDWTIAVLVNDCSLGPKYCYLNPNLKNLKVLPRLNYLPLAEESTLTVTDYAKDWAGNWLKFIGGQGTLKLNFIGQEKVNFRIPYLIRDSAGNYSVDFLELDASQRGTIYLSNFGKKYDSLTIIPSIQEKISGFDGIESFYQFIWSTSIISPNQEMAEEEKKENPEPAKETTIAELKAEIARIMALLVNLQNQLAELSGKRVLEGIPVGFSFNQNLGLGQSSIDVKYLQIVLNSDPDTKLADSGVGSPGQETSYFGPLTKAAVIKFQEKYADDVLASWGLTSGTGFVGSTTRAKLNELLTK